jgi:hypothetical protein
MTLQFYIHRSRDGYFVAWTPSSPANIGDSHNASDGYQFWSEYHPLEKDAQAEVRGRFDTLIGPDFTSEFTRKQLPCVLIW